MYGLFLADQAITLNLAFAAYPDVAKCFFHKKSP